jgi:hypothetical protein
LRLPVQRFGVFTGSWRQAGEGELAYQLVEHARQVSRERC